MTGIAAGAVGELAPGAELRLDAGQWRTADGTPGTYEIKVTVRTVSIGSGRRWTGRFWPAVETEDGPWIYLELAALPAAVVRD